MTDVERLDAIAVAGEQKGPLLAVPQREGEHAVEALQPLGHIAGNGEHLAALEALEALPEQVRNNTFLDRMMTTLSAAFALLATLLAAIGLRILVRFARPVEAAQHHLSPPDARGKRTLIYDKRGVRVAAFVGGITNGMIGAWGPVVTPFLLNRSVSPRLAIGSVNTAEVAVAVVASGSLLADRLIAPSGGRATAAAIPHIGRLGPPGIAQIIGGRRRRVASSRILETQSSGPPKARRAPPS